MTSDTANSNLINHVFDSLATYYGCFDWWHLEEPYEIMVGAILTQNTAWRNVELALANFKGNLSPDFVAQVDEAELASIIRPSGFHNQKALKIKRLTQWFSGYEYDIEKARAEDKHKLRKELLAINGVGGETADAILVYALHKPSFVIDAYTRRIFSRNGLDVPKNYETFREMIELAVPQSTKTYAYYHALMVEHAQQHCNKTPKCAGCPLQKQCTF